MRSTKEKTDEINHLKDIAVVEGKPHLYNAIQALKYGADVVDLLRVINSMEDSLEKLRKSNLQLVMGGAQRIIIHEEVTEND